MTDSLSAHTDYGQTSLEPADLDADPMVSVEAWVASAAQSGIYEPNAMVVSTIDPDGRPSSRTVLLRGILPGGLEFFTDYESRKGRALLSHPDISVVFPWYAQHRQILIYGKARPTSVEVSDAYFSGRPHGSQIAATASRQSEPIASREVLQQRVRDLELKYPEGTDVPRPDNWGGFLIVPERIEFWQGRTSRLHDRIRYTLVGPGQWAVDRLQP